MPRFHMTIAHTLPREEVLQRIQKLLANAKREHGHRITDLEESWKGFTGTFSMKISGIVVSGTLTVEEKAIELDGSLPWRALPFKGTIEGMIRTEAEKILK